MYVSRNVIERTHSTVQGSDFQFSSLGVLLRKIKSPARSLPFPQSWFEIEKTNSCMLITWLWRGSVLSSSHLVQYVCTLLRFSFVQFQVKKDVTCVLSNMLPASYAFVSDKH